MPLLLGGTTFEPNTLSPAWWNNELFLIADSAFNLAHLCIAAIAEYSRY